MVLYVQRGVVSLAVILGGCSGTPGRPSTATGPSSPPAHLEPQPPTVTPLPASARLFASPVTGYVEPAQLVLANPAAWAAAWRTLHQGLDAGPAPTVDFQTDVVVVVAAGERSTGGHAVRVDGTSATPDGGTRVHVTRTAPGAGCMSAQVVTSPAEAVRVRRGPGAVTFAVRDAAAPC
jgi:hypothetical protein